jgi:hypothetical protein
MSNPPIDRRSDSSHRSPALGVQRNRMIEQTMKPTGHGLTRIRRPLSMTNCQFTISMLMDDVHKTIKYGTLLDMLFMVVSW